jgi:transposase
MERQMVLFDTDNLQAENRKDIGAGFFIETIRGYQQKVILYRNGTRIKTVDLSDRVAKRLFVVEVVESGAMQSRLASALNISRQTIHNYLETKKHYGLEGLIHGYAADGKSLRKQRAEHKKERCSGDKSRQLAEIRRKDRQQQQENQLGISFLFNGSR